MEHIAIRAERRPLNLSKGQRKQLRHTGGVLASISGRGAESVAVTLTAADLRRALSAATGMNTLIDLEVEGQKHLVRITDIHINPITRLPLHIGLQEIKASEPQKSDLNIELTGEPEAIRIHAGILEPGQTTVEVRTLPERMVASLPMDISHMQIGDVLRAGDLPLPEGFELLTDPETSIISLRSATVGGAAAEALADEAANPAPEAVQEPVKE